MSEPEAAGPLLAEARALTDARLDQVARRLAGEIPPPLGPAIAYALETAGKRVRPALVIAAYRAAGGADGAIAGVAAAVEVVHTYSLVHDDLPCMDNDARRRGRPTTHIAFDVPTATRVGWLLVPVAVELLAEAATQLRIGPDGLGRMAASLLEAGGLRGMIGGQWLDLEAEGREPGLDELKQVHRGKTGALIQACCELGGMAAGASVNQMRALAAYGREVGLAFQIADDVLDATATTAQLGKTAGRDAVMAKSTYVSLMGVTAAREAARRHIDLAVASLAGSGLEARTLGALASYIISRPS
jgi:geranylgeranyl pyrophosphate synthase